MNRVLVVGAGISGLSTAFSLLEESRRLGRPLDLQVLESAPRAGGKICTERTGGFVCEWGPDGFLDNSPPTLELCGSLGLEPRLVQASEVAGKRRFLLRSGRLVELPASPPGFLLSPVLPLRSRLRVLLEPFIGRKTDGLEESVAAFARRRLGAGFARILVDAMVTGIYGGDPEELSVEAAFPRLKKLEAEHGSLIRGAVALARARRRERQAARQEAGAEAKGLQTGPGGRLTSLRTGLSELVEALASRLGTERLHCGAGVERVFEHDGRLAVEAGGQNLEADQVVVSLPPHRARELLGGLSSELAEALSSFPTAPIAVACLGFRREQVGHPLDGFGFLVPGGEKLSLLGCLFSTSIYPERAPEGHVLLRAMLGGRRQPHVVDQPEEAIAIRTLELLGPVLRIQGPPVLCRVVRHRRAIPQYTVGHLARVAAVQRAAERWPGLHITGNAFHGVSLNDCIRTGLELGSKLAGRLRAEP
jgi:oxygen-dependent protoporphyrinogen oxidase